MNGVKRQRDSGIELLKIIAVFIIVISHVVQTLVTYNRDVTYGGMYWIFLRLLQISKQLFF